MFEFLFSQYKEYETIDVVLEIIAVLFGLVSVLFAKKNNILVYPTGIISTIIFVYLLNKWGLLGDLMINVSLDPTPIIPALSFSLEVVMTESLLTRFSEYFRTAVFMG